MKKQLLFRMAALALSVCMCAALCACGSTNEASPANDSGDKEETVTIKLNTSWGENSSVQVAALRFGEILSEESDGHFKVKVYPSNQLASGNQQTAVEMVQNGDLEVSLFGMTVLSFLDDRLAVVNMPFMISSYEEADQLIFDENAESRQILENVLSENGMVPLGFGEAGFRQITNNKREVRTPEDMAGLKFRVLSTCPMFFDLYKALDANPTAINMSEVFTSLQQGVIDGQENAVDTCLSWKINEVQDYITCWNGVYDAVAFVGSPKFLEGLSEEDQQLIKDCAQQAMTEQRDTARASEEEILSEFAKTMTVTKLTDEEIDAFRVAVKPVCEQWYDSIGADIMTAFGYTK